ncbi:MAG: indolepyruvate oxidoreductase subunit beta [Synergistaceae bacterium]|nr:indolepyruvate oxidoreductase subunit beta [Candidatus Equadaptatus faecalis]
MNDTKSILLVGVGGQGTILASKILSEGLARKGFDIKMSEIHGMSQRGGSVSTHVRYGSKVASPIVSEGEADVLVAFEKSEAVRWLNYLKKGGWLVVNNYEIKSLPVLTGLAEYPEQVIEQLNAAVENVKIFNATQIARELGNERAQNIVLLGALIKALGIADMDWDSVLEQLMPAKVVELNKKALHAGMEQ